MLVAVIGKEPGKYFIVEHFINKTEFFICYIAIWRFNSRQSDDIRKIVASNVVSHLLDSHHAFRWSLTVYGK